MFDILWISIAFFLGMIVTAVKLPPMIGYLAAGFLLRYFGIESFPGLSELSELGISLLLFSIGLKLNLKSLGRKEILGVAMAQGFISFIILFGLSVVILGTEQLKVSSILAFGLTFSSTIFVFKILEDRGDFATAYGKNSIGILVIQDIMAVLFMAFNANKVPSAWLILLISMLWPLRVVLSEILKRLKHSELMILFGLSVSFGGAYLFDLVNVKGDLGALILGVLLSKHERAAELNRWLISFKDFFLLGFFLSIGLTGLPTWEHLSFALLFSMFVPLRAIIYFFLFARTRLRSRNSFLAALGLSNFSEFGLIVVSFAVARDFLGETWLTTMALTLSFSFIISAILNRYSERLYRRYSSKLASFQRSKLHPLERDISLNEYNVMVIGMGRVGQGAYEALVDKKKWWPVGVDVSEEAVKLLKERDYEVVHGNATNPDFWYRVDISSDNIKQILLAMPVLRQNILAAKFIRGRGFKGSIASVAKYPNDVTPLLEAGVDQAFNLYAEAGNGLAQSVCD
ncbi:MAG: cation:proton antiporter [Bacteriovoracaceae bacterium]